MRKLLSAAWISCALLFSSALAPAQQIQLIPEPVKTEAGRGEFDLTSDTYFLISEKDSVLDNTARLFIHTLSSSTRASLRVLRREARPHKAIKLTLLPQAHSGIGQEGYLLSVKPNQISISANQPAGIFYGLQTLLQLLPPEVESKQALSGTGLKIPAVEIMDYPRFAWRGLMLDVSRHFFSKEDVKKYIDQMVKYKYNVFHWHLTDDNGWRIQIKSLPLLTAVGGWRVPRSGEWGTFSPPQPDETPSYGGYYTQDDIREIIDYARQRFVTVIPEIDVPGHSLALIASYPNLSCTKQAYPVNPGSPFYKKQANALCVGIDSTFEVLDKIFTEVAELFPSKYIHIGGDEAYKGFWERCTNCRKRMDEKSLKNTGELQSYFVKRTDSLLRTKNKRLIGWDEILEGGLAPEATVMSWRGMKGGIEAAKMGHQVIMTPWENCYLDLYQGDPSVEPATYGQCRLSDAYNFDPVPPGTDSTYILGGQGNLWTESVADLRHAEYMTWPRGMALAEVFWTPQSKRSWNFFISRLERHFERFRAADVNFAATMYQPIIRPKKDAGGQIQVELATEVPGLEIYYSFEGSNPAPYPGTALTIPRGVTALHVVAFKDGQPVSKQISIRLSELEKRIAKLRG